MIEFRSIEPVLFTPEEACAYLRLDDGRSMDSALKALGRLVDDKKLIRPTIVGKRRRYWRAELDRFIEEQTA